MKVEVINYRAIAVPTDLLLELASIKSCQGMDFNEVESKVIDLFPKWNGLKAFVQVPVFDDGVRETVATSNICIEVSRMSLDVPVAPKGELLESDRIPQIELDRLDGALLFILNGIGIKALPHDIVPKTCVLWKE